ncbi:MAG: SpoIIE family protein phosphatase [Bryobacteraceae bacterium]
MPEPALIVTDPSGNRTRMAVAEVPYKIGRQTDNHLVVRDSRVSRNHARIVFEEGDYFIEDTKSRHGVYVNGVKVERSRLKNSDRIEFGFSDSYQLTFSTEGSSIGRQLDQLPVPDSLLSGMSAQTGLPPANNLTKLRAVLEVARALESALTAGEVLNAVVDAALAITNTERGFLLFRKGEELEMRVARDRHGEALGENDLRVPRRLIHRALQHRRELLSMNFDPHADEAGLPPSERSIADLELRSVVCVPLVHVRLNAPNETGTLSSVSDTIGVLYMDSRHSPADMAAGNRELLQTLAIEASTILENARLLEEERLKHKIEEELSIARRIQQSLLPRAMPAEGWFRASGSSVPSSQVGGDYFDVMPVNAAQWAAVVADVAGKGVSSALLASLLQGAFLSAFDTVTGLKNHMESLNRFLCDRTAGDKYATIFCCTLDEQGLLRYANAGHCAPWILRRTGELEMLEPTGLPVGLLTDVAWTVEERRLEAGDKLFVYSDGVTEAVGPAEEFFGTRRLKEALLCHAAEDCQGLHDAVRQALDKFTAGVEQSDDETLLVLGYRQ